MAVSSGTGEADAENVKRIVDEVPDIKYLCVDVANGYSEHFVAFVSDIRKQFPNQTIMVSNELTAEHCINAIVFTIGRSKCTIVLNVLSGSYRTVVIKH